MYKILQDNYYLQRKLSFRMAKLPAQGHAPASFRSHSFIQKIFISTGTMAGTKDNHEPDIVMAFMAPPV